MGVAFRRLAVGRSRWRLVQSRDRGRQGSTTVVTAFMGLTSFRRITIARTLAYGGASQRSASMPIAVSLWNAPPTAPPHL